MSNTAADRSETNVWRSPELARTYLAMADSIGLAMQNAVACQQRSQITANTATTVATARILRAASG